MEAPLGYNQVYGANRTIPLERMTLDQALAWQKREISAGTDSSAIGRYQFINKTLKSLKSDMGLSGNEVMDKKLQDRMAVQLLKRRGFEQYAKGKLSKEQFANNLAKEFASLPVASGRKKGRSYYADDGLNKSLVSVSDIMRYL